MATGSVVLFMICIVLGKSMINCLSTAVSTEKILCRRRARNNNLSDLACVGDLWRFWLFHQGTREVRYVNVRCTYKSDHHHAPDEGLRPTKAVKALANFSFSQVYHKLAIYLTNIENPRTQIEYEDSYTFKIFVFEFMNYYSSLIYIAFFKGRFYDYPGDDGARKNEFFKLKGDICDPAGCLSELCIQLSIIMIGKQFVNNFMEYLYPWVS